MKLSRHTVSVKSSCLYHGAVFGSSKHRNAVPRLLLLDQGREGHNADAGEMVDIAPTIGATGSTGRISAMTTPLNPPGQSRSCKDQHRYCDGVQGVAHCEMVYATNRRW